MTYSINEVNTFNSFSILGTDPEDLSHVAEAEKRLQESGAENIARTILPSALSKKFFQKFLVSAVQAKCSSFKFQ